MRLEEVEPEVFSIFVPGIYTQDIRDGCTKRRNLASNKMELLCALADRLKVPALQDQAMKLLKSMARLGLRN